MLAAIVAAPLVRAAMAHRNKNLLEAFSASATNEKSAQDVAENGASSSVGGPFASPPQQESILTHAERELVKDASATPPAFAQTLLRPENYQGLIAVVVIVAAVSFLIGRATSSGVTAAPAAEGPAAALTQGEGEAALATTPIPLPGAGGAPIQLTSEEADRVETDDALRMSAIKAQLLDPANKYTITVVQYKKGRDEHLATPTLYYLLDQGLPASMLYRGERLLIVVGAAPKQVDLDDLLQRAQTMAGPPPGNRAAEFHDAYLDKIDNIIDRP